MSYTAKATLTALLAVLAFVTAVSAAAATEPYFKAENSKGEVTTLTSGQTRTATISMPYAGAVYIPGVGVEIYCSGASGSGTAENHYSGATRREGRVATNGVTLEGCGVLNEPSCDINGAASGSGKIKTNPLVGRLGYEPGSSDENVEAILYSELWPWFGVITSIEISDCIYLGYYEIDGDLIAGVGPNDTMLETTIQGVTTVENSLGEAEQEFKEIEFPAGWEKYTGEELHYNYGKISIEGALEFTMPAGEKLGVFTS